MMDSFRPLLVRCFVVAVSLLGACAPVGDSPLDPTASRDDSADRRIGEEVTSYLPAPRVDGPGELSQRIEAAIAQVDQRDVQVSNGFWTVFHGILGQGPGLMLYDPATKGRVNAIDYICAGGELRGMRFIPTEFGLDVQMGPTFVGQGHADQFLAEMIQVGVPADQSFVVHGKRYTLMDFVRHSQSRVRVTADQELSWAIVAIGEFVGTDARWTNGFGEPLAFEDLVRYELDQDVEQAACGGTHRLFGLSWVHHLHIRNGGQEVGVWREIAAKMATYRDRAREFQNADGSFSTNSFRGPGDDPDVKARITTTGHILEWLALSLTDAELDEPWVRNAANSLSRMIMEIQDAPMEGGALYHAVHGLRLFRSRQNASPTLSTRPSTTPCS